MSRSQLDKVKELALQVCCPRQLTVKEVAGVYLDLNSSLGINQSEVARALGVTPQAVSYAVKKYGPGIEAEKLAKMDQVWEK